jgi:hypothetical protein
MNENLSQMVKDTTPKDDSVIFSESSLDLPIEEEVETAPETSVIGIISLFEWFNLNSERFDNINQVKVSIRGVDPTKTLIMAVKDGSGEKDPEGNDLRDLRVFENADTHPVLSLAGVDMQIYNNGFRILYEYNGIYIKCYGIRTGLIATFCNDIEGRLIPYSIVRIKKKDTNLEIPTCDINEVGQKLQQNADTEALQLLYRQSSKVLDQFTTYGSVIDWLATKQDEVTDINHHLQIDNVIIDILK